jgi:D-alanine--poly(phosphoribitol) ligase subunit 1
MQLNVLEYFRKGALAAMPSKTALVEGDRSMTFADLQESATMCAVRILDGSPSLGSPIAVFLPKGVSTIVADLGILYVGCCYTNLDTKSPIQRIGSILDNLKPALVLTNRDLAGSIEGLGLDRARILLMDDPADAAPDEARIARRLEAVIDRDPVCIINTSGSTGVPKSVVMNHRSIIDFMDWLFDRFDFGPDERIGSLSPFYFDIYTLELWYCLAKGATLVMIPEQSAVFPVKLVEFLEREDISFIFWVPTVMVNIANQDLFATSRPGSLRNVLFAGEVFPTKHLNYWRRNFPETRFINLYGPIEITVDCTYFVVDREFPDDEPLPIGFPCRNTDVLILDDKDAPALAGRQGELCVRGSSLAMGYWNDPEKTREAFVQNPLNTRYPETIYRTGDLVHLNERGEILFDGRKDFQIKHQGYRIELGEIEHVLLSVMGDIDNACVLYNQDRKEIALFFESRRSVAAAEIRQRLGEALPKYMLPTAFHQLDAMQTVLSR